MGISGKGKRHAWQNAEFFKELKAACATFIFHYPDGSLSSHLFSCFFLTIPHIHDSIDKKRHFPIFGKWLVLGTGCTT
ncbi:MAG: hypothetical protein ACOX9E_04430 [Lentisphaeria bacterium]|jgi:hypothetical protein